MFRICVYRVFRVYDPAMKSWDSRNVRAALEGFWCRVLGVGIKVLGLGLKFSRA